ncbi:MAG: glutamine-hydrolyzing carbamoyl-phosphate synthase small subunit [Verrucomicrobia bacterium]|nr:glutamine-hydrolyzing carbamoyl-phosphate synthase small subunit [Verrucomicrobiota bacterium]
MSAVKKGDIGQNNSRKSTNKSLWTASQLANKGLLILEDGTPFWGESVGAEGFFVGEVIFHTAMTGYQEILTDPSYAGQMINFTTSHIGNVGINEEDWESDRVWPGGIIVKQLSETYSNWRASGDLRSLLRNQNVLAITGVDTRKLTHLLRERGAMRGCMMAGCVDLSFALRQAQQFEVLDNWVIRASCKSLWKMGSGAKHAVVLDFGVKRSILDCLVQAGYHLTIVPSTTDANLIAELMPDRVVLSNGPGDPAMCGYAIETTRALLEMGIPLFGICFGHQLLALASGAKTVKMVTGHHGANHPVQELKTGKVFVSCQNHGFMVEEKGLPSCLEITHRSLFDGSIAGLRRKDKPALSFQGHPEGSPGPHELRRLFAQTV